VNHWFSRDLDAMAEVTGCLPILVDADAGECEGFFSAGTLKPLAL